MAVASIADKLLTRADAAEYLGFQPQTLALWASTGRHDLPLIHIGRSVRYRLSDLDAWLASRSSAQKDED
jgi:excisionase family DNA binding protein